ncbi:hypothetical protein [Mucilaginibacter lappiensis]|uniref:Uncharacterized protein n=1 Tax=Mucilaginibacter lappiensis TaxID=354630 RepID=A0A841JEY1_9SPHI|nr:hypothetical protein [Mucilaginibacter lappiensis]MBB6129410.1 hypothetical protein [Mucilaginibacter lappiensis]
MKDEALEKLDTQEEVINQLIKDNRDLQERQSAMETKASLYPQVYIPDYNDELKQMGSQLTLLNENYAKERWQARLDQLDKRIQAIPKVIPVEHHHHFGPKSKWMLIIYFMLILLVAVLTGTTIGYAFEAHELRIAHQTGGIVVDSSGDNKPKENNIKKSKSKSHKHQSKHND